MSVVTAHAISTQEILNSSCSSLIISGPLIQKRNMASSHTWDLTKNKRPSIIGTTDVMGHIIIFARLAWSAQGPCLSSLHNACIGHTMSQYSFGVHQVLNLRCLTNNVFSLSKVLLWGNFGYIFTDGTIKS